MIHQENRKPEAVVLGNGPSLRGFDFRRLARFDVFGMNAAYRYWYEIGWFPQYYSCLDLVVGPSHHDAIVELIRSSDRLGLRGFLLRQAMIEELGKDAASPKVFNFDALRPGFECWVPGPVTTGSHTCAWASILGYKDIYLLGIDCNYIEIVPNAEPRGGTVLEITADAPNPNYFFDSYQQKGDKFNIPNHKKDLHISGWRNVGDKLLSKSRVLNANFASKVDRFPFVRFDDVEKGGRVPIYSPLQVLGNAPLGGPAEYVLVTSDRTKRPASAPLSRPIPPQPQAADGGQSMKSQRSILSFDALWRPPIDTEQHALTQALKFLPEVPGIMYFGFPWATLIEQLNAQKPDAGRLTEVLASARPLLAGQKHVITVCRHKDLLKHQQLFAETGITHVFWPHAVEGHDCFPEHKNIKIFPFPFFSDQAAPSVVRRIPEESPFFLCATGPCSNSARLWEAIGCGSIPVVLPDAFLPGNQALWEEAAVFCSERLEDVRALPDRLEALARDEALLERKRHALRQLWMLYGPDCFIYDILKLFLSLAVENAGEELPGTGFSYGRLFGLAALINRTKAADPSLSAVFALGCSSRVLSDPAGFLSRYRENDQFRRACLQVLDNRGSKYSETLRRALEFKGVLLDPHEMMSINGS